ncbi:glutaminyl-peptide cyclotransferase [Chloroflexota bacterium]
MEAPSLYLRNTCLQDRHYKLVILTRLHGKLLTVSFLLAVLGGTISCSTPPIDRSNEPPVTPGSVQTYTFQVVNTYSHDQQAFTQGLVFDEGFLYEGTGLSGRSSLRKVDLNTGSILQARELPSDYFGEGITVFGNSIIQLTWQSHTGFVYDKDSFELLRRFTYATEGWGITHDGERIIMSDGTSTLYFLDSDTLQANGHIQVSDKGTPVSNLNELEYISGRIYANVWYTDSIAIIDPISGSVTGWIDLTGLLPNDVNRADIDVLNGIAYDDASDRLFVTGKLWPWLFEIELVAKQ